MKKFLPLLFFVLPILAMAQTTSTGYYLTNAGDTVKVEIKTKMTPKGKLINNFDENVEVTEAGNVRKFTSAEIQEFGVFIDGMPARFYARPVKNGGKKFMQAIYKGPESSLYHYGYFSTGGGYTMANSTVFYTFERKDGQYLFLRNMLNKTFRAELKAFYNDNAAAQQVIDSRFKYWLELDKDLEALLAVVNNK